MIMDNGQLMEKFRHVSRDLQNNLQMASRLAANIAETGARGGQELGRHLELARECWDDFSGWVLISNLENIEEARANCVLGLVDSRSKATRSFKKWRSLLQSNGVKFDISRCESVAFDTYIPYFEQLLDLLIGNAIKYSASAGHVEVSAVRAPDSVVFMINSMGPLVSKAELAHLGTKSFRSEEAKKSKVSGQGYGLYNAVRIASFLGAQLGFNPDHKSTFELDGVRYANFSVRASFPVDLGSG